MARQERSRPGYRRQKRADGRTDDAFVVLDGVRHFLGGYDTDESYELYELKRTEQRANAGVEGGALTTVNEVCAAFWRHARNYYRNLDGTPSHEISSYRMALRPMVKLYGDTSAIKFGPRKLKAVRQAMIDAGLTRKGINARVLRIRTVFKWAASDELVPASVGDNLATVAGLQPGKSEAVENEPVTPVPDGHIEAVKPYVSRQVAAMIDLQLLTAARPGELVGMRLIDVDVSGKVWLYKPPFHKNTHRGKPRTIYLGPKAQAIVRQFMHRPVDAPLFSPREARNELAAQADTHRRPNQVMSDRKTDRRVSEQYTVAAYRRSIHRACEKAGIDQWSPHRLRHSAGTQLRKEFGVEAAATMLGHAGIQTSLIYAERNEQQALAIAAKIG